MFSIPHLIVIFVVALIIFGPEKLPELARNLGKVMAEFRRATGDLQSTFEGHLRDIEREATANRIGNEHPIKETVLPPSPFEDIPSTPPEGTKPSNAPNTSAIAAGNAASASEASPVVSSSEQTGAMAPGNSGLPDSASGNAPQSELFPPADSTESERTSEHTFKHVSDGGSGQS